MLLPEMPFARCLRAAVVVLLVFSCSAEADPADPRSAIEIEDFDELLPPIALGNRRFTVVVHKKRLVWPKEAGHAVDPDDDETAVSFDVRDAGGNSLYSYRVVDNPGELDPARIRAEGRFSFSYAVHPYLLEGSAGSALMIDWYFFPSAPNACSTHVVLGLIDGKLTPFGEPFCATLRKLEKQRNTGDDILVDRWWNGYYTVLIPIRVDFTRGKLAPSLRCRRLDENAEWNDLCEFPVETRRQPSSDETFVRLFPEPGSGAVPRHVVVKPDSEIEFLSALAPNLFDEAGNRRPLSVDVLLWLKVRIDGREGWLREDEDLLALGLHRAG
jgi:hypothetical protein